MSRLYFSLFSIYASNKGEANNIKLNYKIKNHAIIAQLSAR